MSLRIDIVTLFGEMFEGFRSTSIVGRAVRNGLVEIHLTDLRRFALDSYGSVDDAPFGGGPGMVLMCQPVFDAVEAVRKQGDGPGTVVMLSCHGRRLDQDLVRDLAGRQRLVLLAGHYEGFDERIRTHLADIDVSVGDYVLSGGELAAMVLADAVIRLQPGVLGKAASLDEESFGTDLLEYPQYTRPREFRGLDVPDVLLNGDHAKIAAWRRSQAMDRTRRRRPDLWRAYQQRQGPADGPDDTAVDSDP